MAISRNLEITIKEDKAEFKEKLFIFQNDMNVDLFISITDTKYRFTPELNLMRNLENAFSNATVLKPNGDSFRTERIAVEGDKIKFTITEEMCDELDEVGVYKIQFHLYDGHNSRVSIPGVIFDVKELIATVNDTDATGKSKVDEAVINEDGIKLEVFDGEVYLKTIWQTGDTITANKLNKIEEGIHTNSNSIEKITTDLEGTSSETESNSIAIEELTTDFYGKKHNTAKKRFDVEFANVLDKINNAQHMEFQGSNIGAKTFESYTKEMEIRGNVYQNFVTSYDTEKFLFNRATKSDDNIFKIQKGANVNSSFVKAKPKTHLYKPSTKYTVVVDILSNTTGYKLGISGVTNPAIIVNSNREFANLTGISALTFTTRENIDIDYEGKDIKCDLYFGIWEDGIGEELEKSIRFKYMLLEGDYTNNFIPPYFEGIKFCGEDDMVGSKYRVGAESIGKNLFDGQLVNAYVGGVNGTTFTGGDHTRCAVVKCYKGIKYTCSKNAGNRNTLNFFTSYPKHGDNAVTKTSNSTMISPIDGYLVYYVTTDATIAPENIPTEVQIEQSDNITPYEPYKRDFQYFLLDEPHMSTHETVSDTIDKNGILNKIIRKKIFNGNETWGLITSTPQVDTLHAQTQFITTSQYILCDKVPCIPGEIWFNDKEGIAFNDSKTSLQIRVLRSKLETQDLEGLKKWLRDNTPTLYYAMQNPIKTDLNKEPMLKTWEGKTYINSTNSIPSTLKVKMSVDSNAMLYDVIEYKKVTDKEHKEINENQNFNLNLLSEMDTNIISTNWDMDYRISEVEWLLEDALPVKLNINTLNLRGGNTMALSRFEQAKIMILGDAYNREILEKQLRRYLEKGQITQEEFDTLISMMDAKEMVSDEITN